MTQSKKKQTINSEIKAYLAKIGKIGGLRSRRKLSTQQSHQMLRIREARRAFKRFKTLCFWSYNSNLEIKASDIPWVIETLRKNGNREAWKIAEKLCH
jgi:hypothetical protein